jgi:hypothetical protein
MVRVRLLSLEEQSGDEPGISSDQLQIVIVKLTGGVFNPLEETLWCTASVGISTYPGRHCCKTSVRTLSKASVQVVSVTGGIEFKRA